MSDSIVVSALRARTNFDDLLRRVEDEGRSLVIMKRGTPRAVLLSIREYVRLAAPEPEILKIIGEQSKAKGTATSPHNRLAGSSEPRVPTNQGHHIPRVP